MARLKRSITLGMMMIMFVSVVGLAGCGRVPDGYSQKQHPILRISSNTAAGFNFRHQFPELNNSIEDSVNKHSLFLHRDIVHYIVMYGLESEPFLNGEVSIWNNRNVIISVYEKNTDNGNLGNLILRTDNSEHSHFASILFLDGDYIYYQLSESRFALRFLRFQPYIWNIFGRERFFKYSFFRFNLNTGVNEEVGLEHFFEKLVLHNPNVRLNPNFNI